MPNTISPNMSLILPTVGQEPGPNWALDLNSSLSLIDQHNHAPGSGVQITPAGLNINVDLPFGGNNATGLKSTRFNAQVAPLATGNDVGCLYVSGQDLYFNDTIGNQIKITQSGAVNGTPGSIGNLIAPAAVNYVPANQTFVFQSDQTNNTPASLDAGNLYLRNIVPGGNYIQIQPNAVLPGNYSITLPSALPAASKIVRLDNLGNLSATLDVDNSTIEISGNNLQVKDLGITTAKIDNLAVTQGKLANNSVGTAQIIDANVTPVKRTAANYTQADSGTINFNATGTETTIWTQTITTSANNKNILVSFLPYYTSAVTPDLFAPIPIFFRVYLNSTMYFDLFTAGGNEEMTTFIHPCPTAGVQTFTLRAVTGGGFVNGCSVINYRVVMTELG